MHVNLNQKTKKVVGFKLESENKSGRFSCEVRLEDSSGAFSRELGS